MKKTIQTLIVLFTIAFIGACSQGAPEAITGNDKATSNSALEEAAPPAENRGATASAQDLANQVAQGRRLVIHNANLAINVQDPEGAATQAQGIADTLGGFVVNSSSNGSGTIFRSNVTIRVPSDAFDSALGRIRQLGDVQNENVTGQDITSEFVDLQSRLEVQRNLESRYLTLLGNAATVEDAITVEKELARVRTEIEQMEGRQKYLANQAQLATISLDFSRQPTVTESGPISEIGDAFSDSGEIIVSVVAGIIRVLAALLPIASIVFIIGLGVVKFIQRRRRQFDDV